jgi:hypothetical protein
VIVDRIYPPGHKRLATPGSADLKVITNPFDPFVKVALIDPTTEIVNFVP